MKKSKLLIVAHPDDEAIFFGGLVQRFAADFHIVCATDANADGRGQERKQEFQNSCRALGADSFEMWDFPDVYEKRLDIDALVKRIKEIASPSVSEVYTHGPLGEYGHPHHQDVCHAVYKVFEHIKILSPSYNAFPTELVQLSKKEFDEKARVLTTIYGKETQRFLNIVPVTFIEGFVEVSHSEEAGIHEFLTGKKDDMRDLECFAHMEDYIKTKLKGLERLF